MLPYDGSPGGNALGMQFDEERRRSYEAATNASLSNIDTEDDGTRTPLQIAAYLLSVGVFLTVMFYGTVG